MIITTEENHKEKKYLDEILAVMSLAFEGNDFSFVFFDILNNLVISYRDIFGKRSLIYTFDAASKEIIISSVSFFKKEDFQTN